MQLLSQVHDVIDYQLLTLFVGRVFLFGYDKKYSPPPSIHEYYTIDVIEHS